MKKQAIVTALGVLVALAMTAPSFAATSKAHTNRAKTPSAYTGYYDSAVPEGHYTGYAPSYATGGLSGSMGGVGR
ncbi:MAG: hypothetical protein WAL80_08475 [Xanthobacteraceae bacterium]|jgi:hypothetical protein